MCRHAQKPGHAAPQGLRESDCSCRRVSEGRQGGREGRKEEKEGGGGKWRKMESTHFNKIKTYNLPDVCSPRVNEGERMDFMSDLDVV